MWPRPVITDNSFSTSEALSRMLTLAAPPALKIVATLEILRDEINALPDLTVEEQERKYRLRGGLLRIAMLIDEVLSP